MMQTLYILGLSPIYNKSVTYRGCLFEKKHIEIENVRIRGEIINLHWRILKEKSWTM